MEYEVVITDDFARDVKRLAKKFPSLKDDLLDLQKSLKKANAGRFFGERLF